MPEQKKDKRWILILLVIAGIVLVIIAIVTKIAPLLMPGEVQIIDSETLKKKVNVSELSTAKFTYNGIAEYYENDKEICKIYYHAEVKAGIDMSNIDFEINESDKTIKPILPEITINSNVVDETALSFIPSKTTVKLSDAIKACKADVQKEVDACDELWKSAKDCLKNSIEGLLYPIAQANDYTIIWDE